MELSFKIKKHHSDTGNLTRRRSGRIPVDEYVAIAARSFNNEVKRIVIELVCLKHKAKQKRSKFGKQKNNGNVISKSIKKENKKNLSLSSLAERKDPLRANQDIINGVFIQIPLKTMYSDARGSRGSVVSYRDATNTPATQQSQNVVLQVEENSKSAKGVTGELDEVRFRTRFKKARATLLPTCSYQRIASFLTENCL